jgi:hypothetical protein
MEIFGVFRYEIRAGANLLFRQPDLSVVLFGFLRACVHEIVRRIEMDCGGKPITTTSNYSAEMVECKPKNSFEKQFTGGRSYIIITCPADWHVFPAE